MRQTFSLPSKPCALFCRTKLNPSAISSTMSNHFKTTRHKEIRCLAACAAKLKKHLCGDLLGLIHGLTSSVTAVPLSSLPKYPEGVYAQIAHPQSPIHVLCVKTYGWYLHVYLEHDLVLHICSTESMYLHEVVNGIHRPLSYDEGIVQFVT